MLPWGHAAVGYLFYSVYSRVRNGKVPAGLAVVALAVGTQFPDLIDKPLAWTFGVLPSGRSLGHSVFALAMVGGVVLWLGRRRGALPAAVAFVVGWGSHLMADGYTLLLGEPTCIRYLVWPLANCTYEEDHSFVEFFLALELHALWPEFALAALTGVVWLFDGAPGLRYLFEQVRRR